jgi:hypothetical protein
MNLSIVVNGIPSKTAVKPLWMFSKENLISFTEIKPCNKSRFSSLAFLQDTLHQITP